VRAKFAGLPAALAGLVSLPACSAHAGEVGESSTSPATTAVPAPISTTPRTEKWIELAAGDCLADPPPSDPSVIDVAVVDCAAPHAAEVYSRVPVAVDAAIADVADRECAAGFTGYTGQAVAAGPLAVTYLIDSNQDRTGADPEPSTVICLLQAASGEPLTGSARR
jgi:hypothetical protein